MLKAVLFDMDGVIVDSEPMHARAAVLALEKYNIQIPIDYAYQFIGTTTYVMCQTMVNDFQLNIKPEQLLADNNEMKSYLLSKEGYQSIPFIIDVIKNLNQCGIKLIIASSSAPDSIENVMESLQIKSYFNGYISGTTVARPKPAPDIFLEAAKRLGVSPNECIVIEDSYNGITAANAAGMISIGFVNPNSGKQDLSKATVLVEGFDEVDYDFINNIYQYTYKEPVTILSTDHLILRELSISDIERLHQICQKPEINVYLDDYSSSLEIEKEKLNAYIQNVYRYYGFGLWGVYLKESDCLIGQCGIELKMHDGEEIYEIGYLLDSIFQGQGYAKEIVTATIDYAFRKLDIKEIFAIIDKNNQRSIHLSEQIGMRNVGECQRNHRNCYKYKIIRSSL